MRTAICLLLAGVAALAGASAVLLALTGGVVADPDRPGRLGAVALTSPAVREEATDFLVERFGDQAASAGLDDRQVRRAAERAVQDPAVRSALAEAEVTDDGRLRLDGVYDAVADRLEQEGRTAEAQRLRDLTPRAVDAGPVADELAQVTRTARLALWGGALVAGLVSLVAGSLAMAAARRRLRCLGAMVLGTGALLAVSLELLPRLADDASARDPGWLDAARGLDEVLGSTGTVTAAVLLGLGLLLLLLGLRSPRPT